LAFIAGGPAAPEAVLVEGLGLAPEVVDGPPQPGRQDGQGLPLAVPPGLPLLPAPGPVAATQEQAGGLAQGPAQGGVADLPPAGAEHLAVRLVGAADQAGVGEERPDAGEALDVVDLV